jgi:CubicO group peptidase (beta-lactamase class C family)
MNRKNFKLLVILFLAAVGLVFCNKCTSKRGENSETLTLRQAIDNIVMPRLKIGAIIGVILRNQRHVFAYGTKERNGSEAPDSNTIFEIGSNTKTFTAIILANMHLEGDVNLEDNVEIYHPLKK